MPGVEAALCGLPMVATPNSGIDLLVDGVTGWEAGAYSPRSFAAALHKAEAAHRAGTLEAMGQEARRRALAWDVPGYAASCAATLRRELNA